MRTYFLIGTFLSSQSQSFAKQVNSENLVSAATQKIILEAHNRCRQSTRSPLPPMTWDASLGSFGASVGSRLAKSCALSHSSQEERLRVPGRWAGAYVGENLALPYAADEAKAAECVDPPHTFNTGSIGDVLRTGVGLWCSEGAFYSVKGGCRNPRDPGWRACGHYTQVVWQESVSVGCGLARCSSANRNSWVLACEYAPGGNYMGQAPYGRPFVLPTPHAVAVPTTRRLTYPAPRIPPTPVLPQAQNPCSEQRDVQSAQFCRDWSGAGHCRPESDWATYTRLYCRASCCRLDARPSALPAPYNPPYRPPQPQPYRPPQPQPYRPTQPYQPGLNRCVGLRNAIDDASCGLLTSGGFCTSTYHWYQWVKFRCAASCNACPTQTTFFPLHQSYLG